MTQPTEPDFEREESDRIMKIVRGEAPLSQYAIPELVIEDALKAAYQRGVADGEGKWRPVIDQMCEDEEECREIARQVLTEFEVEGDSYEVPSMQSIMDLLVAKIRASAKPGGEKV